MLRPFQVNVGSYLVLSHDILPTAKVADLCSSIEAVSGEKSESQVLLTADGRQMDPRHLIGNYSVGTEDKPLFVFYRSYLNTSDPPVTSSRLPHKGALQKQLEILRQRPSPSLFQHQVALSKRLGEYSVELGKVGEKLSEEYSLQLRGWRTVLSNCSSLIGMFQKHHQLFCKAVEKFKDDKPHHLDLLQQFPEQVKVLQQLPMPTSLQKSSSSTSSLYDWISTHDEKNSLMDLSTECKKALAKVDGEQLETALLSWGEIHGKSSEVLGSEDKSLETVGEKIRSDCAEVRSLLETIMGLSKNIQLTSDKAFRSGDAKTIAVLVESHHKSLQLMANHSAQLETITMAAEDGKRNLTCHIHTRLKLVMQLQKKVADSNGKLVLLHEHIKLARRRFEILEQVCSTPLVLSQVSGEVSRRRAYNTALEKVMEGTISRLRRAREEEKRLRKSFQSNHGVHFVTSLFPELQDRVPEITFHSPKSLSKAHDQSLEAICNSLPQNMRPSTAMASSVQLLLVPEDSESPIITQRGSQSVIVSPEVGLQDKSSQQTSSRSPVPDGPKGSEHDLETLKAPSEETDRDLEALKELVGKLELANVDLSSKLKKSLQDKSALRENLAEKELACSETVQRLKESQELAALLQSKVSDLEVSKMSFETDKLQHAEESSRDVAEKLEKELQIVSQQLKAERERAVAGAKEFERVSQELQAMSTRCEQLTAEREKALAEAKESAESLKKASQELDVRFEKLTAEKEKGLADAKEQISKLQSEHTRAVQRLEDTLRDNLTQAEGRQERELLALQAQLSQANSEKMETKKELESNQREFESKLSAQQEAWGTQRQALEQQLLRYQEEQRVQREALVQHSNVSDQLVGVKGQLQEREQALEQLRTEIASLKKEREGMQGEMQALKKEREGVEGEMQALKKEREGMEREMQVMRDELSRQQQRSLQAQAAMNSSRAQLEAVDGKRKELTAKLEDKEAENLKLSTRLQELNQVLSEVQNEVASLKSRHAEELRGLEVRVRGEWEGRVRVEAERANNALQKLEALENTQNQRQPVVADLEKKLESATARITELEADISRKKQKLLSADGRLQQTERELNDVRMARDRVSAQLQACREERVKQKDDSDHRSQEMQAKLEKTLREHEATKKNLEAKTKDWTTEKDGYIRQVMELEREVKELRRDTGQGSPGSTGSGSKPAAMERMSSSAIVVSSGVSSAASPSELPREVAVHSLQVGQVALFMSDPYGNFLALTLDGKTYYLDSDSARALSDMGIRISHLNLRKRILIGRITSRLFMEVRKENNRLKVPVGSRLYKLQAEQVAL